MPGKDIARGPQWHPSSRQDTTRKSSSVNAPLTGLHPVTAPESTCGTRQEQCPSSLPAPRLSRVQLALGHGKVLQDACQGHAHPLLMTERLWVLLGLWLL